MLKRSEGTKAVVSRITPETLVIASLGFAKYDLFQAENRPRNFYMWNSMGMCASMGLGMALARPDERVVVLQGDGDLLMNLGCLATEANQDPKNMIHIVWDNRMYAITGKQPTATAFRTDLGGVAKACGFESVARCETLDAFQKAVDNALAQPGPHFIHALTGDAKGEGNIPPSPTFIKHRFLEAMGLPG